MKTNSFLKIGQVFCLGIIALSHSISRAGSEQIGIDFEPNAPHRQGPASTNVPIFRHPKEPQGEPSYRKSYVGGQMGVATETSGVGGTHFIYSGRIGTDLLQLPPSGLSVGFYASRMSLSWSRSTILAAEIFAREILDTGFYLGGRFGLGVTTVDAPNVPTKETFAVGPFLGYELPINESYRVLMDASWITVTGVSYLNPFLNFQAGLAYTW